MDEEKPERFKHGILDPEERARQKQASRDRDQELLDKGLITPEQLRIKNSAFAALPLSEFKIIKIGGRPLKPSKR